MVTRGRGRAAGAALVVLGVVLAGCSGGAGAGSSESVGPAGVGALATLLTGSPGAPATGDGRTTGGSPSSSASPDGLPAATATRVVAPGDLLTFLTPSRNIGCELDSTEVRCDIGQHTWTAPGKPADCALDFGHGVAMTGADRPGFVCAGDTAIDPAAAVLPYDQAVRAGDVVCVSTQAYLTCHNLRSGHWFDLSKGTYPPLQ